MNIELSCPSKTFLLGEYSVLSAGSALLMNTEPRFNLVASTRGTGQVDGFHPASPAGLLIKQNAKQFAQVDLKFIDGHNGAGGFGASSAQFLLVTALTQILRAPESKDKIQIEPIWNAYRQLESLSEEGLRPSGADLVGQFIGGLCEVNTEPFSAAKLKWPFAEVDIILCKTGHKLPTHEHLRGLKRFDATELSYIYTQAHEALTERDSQAFFDSVNDFYAELLEMGLVAENTQNIVTSLLTKPFVKAVKGCGAMGSDTIAVFFNADNKVRVQAALKDLDLPIVGDLSQVSEGFKVNND